MARDLLLFLGICDCSRRSCDNILTKGPGSSCMIVVGGAHEASNARPNENSLIIKKRLGFIRLALRNGAALVPVFSFGENDIWNQIDNSHGTYMRLFQDTARKYTGIVPPAIYGRGIFNYNYGILPYRRPITSVVGNPIECPKIENPTAEEVKFYQDKYLAELKRVYNEHKEKLLPNRTKDLFFEE